ncbi:hypothetical protein GTE61_004744 [Salmonella enterica subsp. enterica]|nr:hypothetical protein [Salmonella enterica subsp. enterica]
MKKLTERIEHIGERVTERNQKLPRALVKKMESIRRGEDVILPDLSAGTQNTGAVLSPIPHADSEPKESWLPTSKTNHIPAPNVILRSALFGVVKKGDRQYEKGVLKATFNGYTVKYTGEQLDQSDLDVWLECLQRCQNTPLGHTVRFSAHDFLISISRDTGKAQHEWLKSVFLRLRANDVEISDGKYTYMGSLIFEQYRDEETGDNCLVLNPKVAACFGDAGWTGMNKTFRLQLKGKPLTLWLYGFYSSHAKPLPFKVGTIKELCGSDVKELKTFRQKLKKSMQELAIVTGWQIKIDENDLIVIKK